MTKPGNGISNSKPSATAQTGRRANRQTDRQTDRQTERLTTFINEGTFDIDSGCTGPFLPECHIQLEWCHHRTTPKDATPA